MKEKGFTLIELLAVIVILAIIALITVPVTLNIIEDAKKGAFTDSAYALFDAYKYKQAEAMFTNLGELNISDLDLQNNKFTGGTIKLENGEIVLVNVTDGVYTANGSVKNLVIGDGSTPELQGPTKVAAASTDTHKGIVYLDPTDLTKTCNASNSVSMPGTKEGCMKWYIYSDNGSNYTMILDHNTTAKVAYNSDMTSVSMNEVAASLTNDTVSWNSSLNARLIEANEIARITGNTSFNQDTTEGSVMFYFDSNSTTQTADSTNKSKYAWLYDYTSNCISNGCNIEDSSTSGYWTSTHAMDVPFFAWLVYCYGDLTRNYAFSSEYGLRPVITISKSIID